MKTITYRTEARGIAIELAGQDHVLTSIGGETRRVPLEDLERAVSQEDPVLRDIYTAVYQAARELHDTAAGRGTLPALDGEDDCPELPYVTLADRRERSRHRQREQMLYQRYEALRAAVGGKPISAKAVGVSAGMWNVPDRRNQGQIVLDGYGHVNVWSGKRLMVAGRLDQSDQTLTVESIQIVS